MNENKITAHHLIIIQSLLGLANYFPDSVAGTTATDGQYN
jgi:hypothetical protein